MDVGENISVVASFGPGCKVRPVRFRWTNRLFEVKEITYAWTSKEGAAKIYHFAVSDGKTIYELSFDTQSLAWRVEKIET